MKINLSAITLIFLISATMIFSEGSKENDSTVLSNFPSLLKLSNGWDDDTPFAEWKNIALTESGRVYSLHLNTSNLPEFPSSIGELTELTYLALNDHTFSNIPPEIVNLKKLETLVLIDNNIDSVPPFICKLTNLKFLSLSGNNLKSFPIEVCNLSNLDTLFLNYNDIKSIPSEISKMKSLKKLVAMDCKLNKIPEELALIPDLTFLSLQDNELKDIPVELTTLNLSDGCSFYKNMLDSNTLDSDVVKWLDEYDYYWREDQKVSIISQKLTTQPSNKSNIRIDNNKLSFNHHLQQSDLYILSLRGKIISKKNSAKTIDISGIASGTYILVSINKHKEIIVSQKFNIK